MTGQLNGLLLVDKPADMTSHDVVARVRKLIGQKSVGHTGTLDPLATGLMILVLGEATKLSDYLLASDKSYWVRARLGVSTDTLDRTGTVQREAPVTAAKSDIEAAAHELEGEFEWQVPLFSAAKVDGKKLYEYGRKGEAIELPTKLMTFWDVELDSVEGSSAAFILSCSKGSFVRTWVAQLGEKLGCGAMVEELRRLRTGSFDVQDAVTLPELESATHGERGPLKGFVPMSRALPEWKSLAANPKDARLVANGQVPRDLMNRLVFEQKQAHAEGRPVFVKVVSSAGDLLAILAAEPGQGVKIRRVFAAHSGRPLGG